MECRISERSNDAATLGRIRIRLILVLFFVGNCVSHAGLVGTHLSDLDRSAGDAASSALRHWPRAGPVHACSGWPGSPPPVRPCALRGRGAKDPGHFQDVTGDGGVLKLILREGVEGGRPRRGDDAYIHFNGSIAALDSGETIYNGSTISGMRIDSTSSGEGAMLPRMFKLGSRNTIKGWDAAVARMRKGERALLVVRSDYAYGVKGRVMSSGVHVPPNATLHFEIELLRLNEKDLYNDGGVVVGYNAGPEVNTEYVRHPEENDEVLIEYEGRYEGKVFKAVREGGEWVRLGKHRLPPGLETLLTNEAVIMGRYNVTLSAPYAFGDKGVPPLVPPGASVSYTLHLKDWNSVHDRFLDGSLVVTCLGQPADTFAATARDCTKVNMTLEGRTTSGRVFFPKQNLSRITVGNRQIPEALEVGLALVRAQQRAVIFSSSDRLADDVTAFEYGEALKSDAVWEVSVHSIQRTYQLNMQERLEAARIRKEWGNALFQAERLEDALDKYQAAFEVIRPKILTHGAVPIPQVVRNARNLQDHREARELKAAIHLNKATCLQRLVKEPKDWKEVIEECNAALELRSRWSKALYRRGQAYLATGEPERAMADIGKVVEAERRNGAARRLMAEIRAAQKEKDAAGREVFSRMMAPPPPTPTNTSRQPPSGPAMVLRGLGGLVAGGTRSVLGGAKSVLEALVPCKTSGVRQPHANQSAAAAVAGAAGAPAAGFAVDEESEEIAGRDSSLDALKEGLEPPRPSPVAPQRSPDPPCEQSEADPPRAAVPMVDNLVRGLRSGKSAAGRALHGVMNKTSDVVGGGVGVAAEKLAAMGGSAADMTQAMGNKAGAVGGRLGSAAGGMLGGRVGRAAANVSAMAGSAAGLIGERVGSAAEGLGEAMGRAGQAGAGLGERLGRSASPVAEAVVKATQEVPAAVEQARAEFINRTSIVGSILSSTVDGAGTVVVGVAGLTGFCASQSADVVAVGVEWSVRCVGFAGRHASRALAVAGKCAGWVAPRAVQVSRWLVVTAGCEAWKVVEPVAEEVSFKSAGMRRAVQDRAREARAFVRDKAVSPCQHRLLLFASVILRVIQQLQALVSGTLLPADEGNRAHELADGVARKVRAAVARIEMRCRDDPGRVVVVGGGMLSMFLTTYLLLVAGEGAAPPSKTAPKSAKQEKAGADASQAASEGGGWWRRLVQQQERRAEAPPPQRERADRGQGWWGRALAEATRSWCGGGEQGQRSADRPPPSRIDGSADSEEGRRVAQWAALGLELEEEDVERLLQTQLVGALDRGRLIPTLLSEVKASICDVDLGSLTRVTDLALWPGQGWGMAQELRGRVASLSLQAWVPSEAEIAAVQLKIINSLNDLRRYQRFHDY